MEPEWNHGPNEDDATMLGLKQQEKKDDQSWAYNFLIIFIPSFAKYTNQTKYAKVEYANISTNSI